MTEIDENQRIALVEYVAHLTSKVKALEPFSPGRAFMADEWNDFSVNVFPHDDCRTMMPQSMTSSIWTLSPRKWVVIR